MSKATFIRLVYVGAGFCLFCYVLIRVFSVGITYDEVWTINSFVPLHTMDILNFTDCDANNHLANTLAIKLFFLFGNDSLVVARLPNILAFGVYLFFAFKITSKYLRPMVGLCCFFMLLLNPFLLDFFSLARGYGLAHGFQMGSLYFVFRYFDGCKAIDSFWALLFGALAVLSNFAWLNYWMVILLVLNLNTFLFKQKYLIKKVFVFSALITTILALIIYSPLRKLQEGGNLYYGGNTSFYSDTMVSLAKYTFYSVNVDSNVFASLNVFLIILVLSIFLSFYFSPNLKSSKSIAISILLLCVFSIVSQHFLFGTFYLIDRTALFFYPLLIFSLCFSVNDFYHKWFSKINFLVVSFFGINFFSHGNFYKTAIWPFDAHAEEILVWIDKTGKKQNKVQKVDFSWPFESSFNYYAQRNNYQFLKFVKDKEDRESLNTQANFYIYTSQSLEKVGYDAEKQKIVEINKSIEKNYTDEQVTIYTNIGGQ